MKFTFEDIEYSYPAQLADITLGQRILFHETFGAALDQSGKTILDMPEGLDREIELNLWHLRAATESFSFFTGIELDTVQNRFAMDQVLNVYNASLANLLEEEHTTELQEFYRWKGQNWVIGAPEVTPGTPMTFNEFLTAKEAVRQLVQLGRGKWDVLPYLCCIYLRKEGEEFAEDLVNPDGERMKLMHELPLDIALHVGFFLTATVATYMNIFQSSKAEEEARALT